MAVYIVTVPDADRKMQPVEVSLEIYQVFVESNRMEQRQRYERRMHLDSRPLEHCLHRNAASETLEETFERLELTRNVWCALAHHPAFLVWLQLHGNCGTGTLQQGNGHALCQSRSEKISKILFENMTTFGRFPSYIVRGANRAFRRTLINSGHPFITAFRSLNAMVSSTK